MSQTKRTIESLATLRGNCPMGGDHRAGTSGEWIGRCAKCGQPC